MIKTIAFDLGGVIITISQQRAIARFTEIGLQDAVTRLDPYTQSGIFGDLEEGKITAEDFRRELSLLCHKELTLEDCKYAWKGYAEDVPQRNLDMLDRLHKMGYRVILGSNTNPYMMNWARSEEFTPARRSLDTYLDALYLSYEQKLMKPNTDFFERILHEEGCAPGDMLFVDDGPRNVAAASKVGMKTFMPENGIDWCVDLLTILKKN